MKQSLRQRMTMTIILIVLITLTATCLLANWFTRTKFNEYIVKQVQLRSESMIMELSEQYDNMAQEWNIQRIEAIGIKALHDGYIISVADQNQNTIWDAETYNQALCLEIMDEICNRMELYEKHTHDGMMQFSYPLVQENVQIGAVSVMQHGSYFLSESDTQFLTGLNQTFLVVGMIAAVLALLIGLLLADAISKPIIKAITVTKQIAAGTYHGRVSEQYSVIELNELLKSINTMAEAIERQEELRKNLTADMAHELRTPLTSVSTHIEAMLSGIWEPTQQRLESCYEELSRIILLVKDLEQLSKVEHQNAALKKERIDLYEIANKISENFEYQALEKKLSVTVEGVPVYVYADKNRMAQVMINLISNAVKYTPEHGQIHITTYEKDGMAVCEVKDSGIGIKEKDLPLIFERFYRADKSRNRKTGGAGIGLTITKSIIEAHNGTIEVESEHSNGTLVRLKLPLS